MAATAKAIKQQYPFLAHALHVAEPNAELELMALLSATMDGSFKPF